MTSTAPKPPSVHVRYIAFCGKEHLKTTSPQSRKYLFGVAARGTKPCFPLSCEALFRSVLGHLIPRHGGVPNVVYLMFAGKYTVELFRQRELHLFTPPKEFLDGDGSSCKCNDGDILRSQNLNTMGLTQTNVSPDPHSKPITKCRMPSLCMVCSSQKTQEEFTLAHVPQPR